MFNFEDMESDQVPLLEYMNGLPATLKPVYRTEQPNQSILLYKGALEITQEINQHSVQIQGHGSVEYVWLPSPCIKFKFSIQSTNGLVNFLNNHNRFALLTLNELGVSVDVFIERTSIGGSEGDNLSGRIQKPILQGTDRDLVYVTFHLINFHNFTGCQTTLLKKDSGELKISSNRVSFEVKNWKVTLDQLETAKDTTKQLQAQGGFGITHVGKLEKLDGKNCSGDEARAFLEIFANFLSFARGFKVSLTFLVGYDAEEKQIWQLWESSGGDSWRNVTSWCPTQDAGKLAEVFPGFLSWWQDWEESERLAIYWYLEANYNRLVEQNIILVQVALELISWVLLVEKKETITSTGFDKLPASDKIRLLLSQFGIPLKIPPKTFSGSPNTFVSSFAPASAPIEDLVKLAEDNNWTDGLHAFTEMRNGIIHPEKKKRQRIYKAPFEAKFDASTLGLWYLELVLLAMFDYRGSYTNRLFRNGETEPVPWS